MSFSGGSGLAWSCNVHCEERAAVPAWRGDRPTAWMTFSLTQSASRACSQLPPLPPPPAAAAAAAAAVSYCQQLPA